MKRHILRSAVLIFLVGLFTINFTSTNKPAPEIESSEMNTITCWSQIKEKENVNTVWCSGCQGMVGYKDDGGQGQCTQSNPGEG